MVHIHAEGPAFFAWLPKMFGKRVVVTVHGIDWQREKWQSGLGSKFIHQGEKNAAKYADEVIVLSKGVQKYFLETYGRETHFIPNGVNRPEVREAKLITDHFGLEKDSYILFLGRLVPEKGIRYLVEAFKNVKTDKKLVIAGGSSDTDSFMEELKELAKGDDRILFTGFVQGAMLDELYSNAYIYTLPSDLEGMPLSLLEAMSYGNCCLVSDIPECAEVVEDKRRTTSFTSAASLRRRAFRDKKAGWGSNFCYSYYDNGDKNKIKIKRFPKEGASHEIHYLRGDISRENCFSHWTSGMVYHILNNEKYKGTYVGAKFIMPVPCKHRVLRAPLEQQVRIEDSHAAIMTPEEFAQAQKVIMLQHGNHQAGNYTKRQYPLKGKVYCGYCRKLMKYRVLKKLGPSFNCRFSATAVDSPCKRIPISEKMLEEIVRNALTVQIKQAEHMLEILHERERKALIFFSALERQEEKLSAEKAELVKLRVALYEQYADGNMSKEEFIRQRDAYRVQEDERMEQIQRLRTEKDQIFQPVKKDTDNLQAMMNTVGEAGDVMHLSQNVVEAFIDRIEVFNDERVKIHFTFEDVLADHAE